ncbi:CHAT domain-containing protein, partial [Endothiovibrio diazotrophicus]
MTDPRTRIHFRNDELLFTCPHTGIDERRPLDEGDRDRLQGWIDDYAAARAAPEEQQTSHLLTLGGALFRWLDGAEGWLRRAKAGVTPPWLVEFECAVRDEAAAPFRDAPWELLADGDGFLAADATLRYTPLRRLGRPAAPLPPSHHRLSLLFMAAAPEADGVAVLDFEREEAAILDATGDLGLDLTVEESGCLPLLGEAIAREVPAEAPLGVLHLSCHGTHAAKPALLLEDDEGLPALAEGHALLHEFGTHPPRLLFLSACHTAEGDGWIVAPLSAHLLAGGIPAVLGWSGPVGDHQAILFAQTLYRQLARKAPLERALADARHHLLAPGDDREPARDWHLARLFLGPRGGGPLTVGERSRHRKGDELGHKEFLDTKGARVPVAGRREFVGRRRPLQRAIRALRRGDKAGLLIHGMGRQGKSSLAARIANRLAQEWTLSVVFGRYDAPAVLEAIRSAVGGEEVERIVRDYRTAVAEDPTALEPALRQLLEGPCRERIVDEHGRTTHRPLLLAVDDLERILLPREGGLHTIDPDYIPVLRALLRAFRQADSDSRLLLTSRYTFTLPDDGAELADVLLPLPLAPMDATEGRKQVTQKLATLPAEEAARFDPRRTARCIAAAHGNPGLQDRLFTLAVENPSACDRALDAMEAYLATGKAPEEQQTRDFLDNLVLEQLVGLLTPGERELLRLSTRFQVPLPKGVLGRLAEARGATLAAAERIAAFGLWNLFPVPGRPNTQEAAINELVRPLAGEVTEEEERETAQTVLAPLFRAWGGTDGARRPRQELELARLALTAENPTVAATCAVPALAWLNEQWQPKDAGELADGLFRLFESHPDAPSLDLLRHMGERLSAIGENGAARRCYARALERLADAAPAHPPLPPIQHAALLRAHARLLHSDGELEQAHQTLVQAIDLLDEEEHLHPRTVLLGQIADILQARGQLDDALN